MSDAPTQAELPHLVYQALRMVDERLEGWPDFVIYLSIKRQLEYIKDTISAGVRPTDERLDSLTLGVYAAREFETSDPEFAAALFDISYLFNRR